MRNLSTENERISQLWKVGRLLVGKTQSQLATDLGISQSSISKFESMTLEPSASDWYQFCQYVGIDAHKTLALGYIDGRKKFKHRLFADSLLKLPLKYRQDFLLKVRELIPFRECIKYELGLDAWREFLEACKIEDEIFFVYDFQLSMKVLNDLIAWSQSRNFPLLSKVTPYTGNLKNYGLLQESYAKKKTPQDLLKAIMEDQPYYHQIFQTNVESDQESSHISAKMTKEAEQFFENETLDIFMSYKIEAFKEMLKSNMPGPQSLEVIKRDKVFIFSVSA